MSTTTPLTDAITALTTYANETTGASDTDLSSAVATLVAGYGSGGSSDTQWVRPSDWPDLSQMDISAGDIIYMTSYADVARGFCDIYVTCTGSYTVEVGTISGSTFTAESTHTVTSGTRCQLYYGSTEGTYKVLRVTGTTITNFRLGGNANAITIDTFYGYTPNNGIIDVVGTLPYCTGMTHTYCYNLVNMKIDSVILSGNTRSMFEGCPSLTSLDASGWDVSSVTNMQNMFSGCSSLAFLDVSSWDVSSVTNMYYMFYSCPSLTSLDVSSWDVSSVTNTSSMFQNCYSLTSLDVSGWVVSSVTNMYYMFSSCSSLTSLDVSGWDVSSVTNMQNMFSGCSSLAFLDVSSWDVSSVTNMYYMFYSCNSLTSLDVSSWVVSSVTNMQGMFSGCNSLASLDVSSWVVSSVTNMSAMFAGCSSLTSLDVSGWDVSSVTNMYYMFNGCSSLASLDVSSWDVSSVTNTSSMFQNCYGLHGSVTIPASITQIGTSCFANTRSLYEYHFLSTTPPTLSSTNAFNNMTDYGNKKIYVPSDSLETYQAASNWSTYASYMEGE